ncbi:MAG TPA: hypothetical protein VEL51_02070 [Vicinamibacterales bacterium]|nr:hypothetical protein [Vicinamibacterales bacterium]
MIKKVLGFIVFLLLANAGLRVGMVFFHDQQFKDAVREIALFGAGKSDEFLKGGVMKAASENQVPLDADFIEITRKTIVGTGDHVVIKTTYAVMVQVAPGYARRFDFDYTTP